jgi:ligand-binding sensor domain-containing protein
MKKVIVFVISVFLVSFAAITLFADEWNIYTSCNDVTALAQESEYLWWTGSTGIMKYNRLDGTHRLYTMKDYGEGSWWTATAVAPDGAKWFGATDGMILRFDNSEWTVFKELYGSSSIKNILFDHEGTVWFGTKHGAACFNGSEWKRYGAAEGFTDKEVNAATIDRNGFLWFGANDGAFRFDGNTWIRYTSLEYGLPSNGASALACDEKGVIWVGTSSGLTVYDNGVWKTLHLVDDPELRDENWVSALVPDREGGMWIGTIINLVHLRGGEKTVYNTSNSTLAGDPYTRIHALSVDTDGVLWVLNGEKFGTSTTHLGLACFDGENWSRLKIPPFGNVTAAAVVDAENVKWFSIGGAPTGNRIFSFDGVTWIESEADWSNSIIIDDAGQKWFCTGKGVSCFDGNAWTNYTAENGLPGTQARKGVFDHDGIGWFELDTGLFSFNGSSWTSWEDSINTYGDSSGGGMVNISSIAVDRNNIKWFGTYGYGVLSFDGISWKHYSKDDGLPGNYVRAIAVDHDNVIWAGSGVFGNDTGISYFDGKKWTVFKDGFNITDIAVDEKNLKWFVTDTNTCTIYSVNGTNLRTYSPAWSGGGGYNCIAIDKDGVKWLGSKKIGVVSFRETDGASMRVSDEYALPKGFAILGNSPNPFNPSTTISFTLPASGKANLTVYDITGRKVRTIFSGQMSAGVHSAVWNGRDEKGRAVSSGVYISRLESGKSAHAVKMLLVR